MALRHADRAALSPAFRARDVRRAGCLRSAWLKLSRFATGGCPLKWTNHQGLNWVMRRAQPAPELHGQRPLVGKIQGAKHLGEGQLIGPQCCWSHAAPSLHCLAEIGVFVASPTWMRSESEDMRSYKYHVVIPHNGGVLSSNQYRPFSTAPRSTVSDKHLALKCIPPHPQTVWERNYTSIEPKQQQTMFMKIKNPLAAPFRGKNERKQGRQGLEPELGTRRNQKIMMEHNPFPEKRKERKAGRQAPPSQNNKETRNHDRTEPLSGHKKREKVGRQTPGWNQKEAENDDGREMPEE